MSDEAQPEIPEDSDPAAGVVLPFSPRSTVAVKRPAESLKRRARRVVRSLYYGPEPPPAS